MPRTALLLLWPWHGGQCRGRPGAAPARTGLERSAAGEEEDGRMAGKAAQQTTEPGNSWEAARAEEQQPDASNPHFNKLRQYINSYVLISKEKMQPFVTPLALLFSFLIIPAFVPQFSGDMRRHGSLSSPLPCFSSGISARCLQAPPPRPSAPAEDTAAAPMQRHRL